MLADTDANVFYSDNRTATYGVLRSNNASAGTEGVRSVTVASLADDTPTDNVTFLSADDPWFAARKQVRLELGEHRCILED